MYNRYKNGMDYSRKEINEVKKKETCASVVYFGTRPVWLFTAIEWTVLLSHILLFWFVDFRGNLYVYSTHGMESANLVQAASLITQWELLHTIALLLRYHQMSPQLFAVIWHLHQEWLHWIYLQLKQAPQTTDGSLCQKQGRNLRVTITLTQSENIFFQTQ